MQRRNVLLSVAGYLGLLASCGAESKPQFKSVDITGADYAKDFKLPDTGGKVRGIADFKGKAVIVFFGYTQCPDACPTTMAEIAEAKRLLGADGAKVQPVLISLDPERDKPELLKAYVQNFGPDFIALRGTPEQTKAAADEFKIFYAKVPGKVEGSYTLDHTAGTFVIDTQGNVRLFERYGAGVEAMSADIKALISAPA